jgi:hypothetical protein
MQKGDKPDLDPVFESNEALYRRFDPQDIHEFQPGKFRVLTTGWDNLHSMSLVRGKYSTPDHCRWDAATDPGNPPGFVPQLWRDWYVGGLTVGDIPAELLSTGGVRYEFVPAHVPFEDLYSHSEIQASKDGKRIVKQNKFTSEEVKATYRAVLSNKTVVVLRPDQITPDS